MIRMTVEAIGLVPEWTRGDRLRKAREVTGLTQTAFAQQVGVSRRTVVSYEAEAVEPRQVVLRAWSAHTGVSLTWLETGTAPSPRGGDGAGSVSRLPESNRRPIHYKAHLAAA